jgi:SIR2-like domain
MTLPVWRSSPRARRSIAELSSVIQRSKPGGPGAVLLVGAGVDTAIAGRKGWSELLRNAVLNPTGNAADHAIDTAYSEAFVVAADRWPEEAAEALRISLGEVGFEARITDVLNGPAAQGDSATTDAIASLVKAGVRCILSLNYTDYLAEALRPLLPGLSLQVVNRLEFSAWTTESLLSPPAGHLTILKLHGSLSRAPAGANSGLILDRTSYAVAAAEGSLYRQVLERVFEDYTVVTVGISWRDVPLREAAARARMRRPVASRPHYAVREQRPDPRAEWWEDRLLSSAYGVRSLPVSDFSQLPRLLQEVAAVGASTNERGQSFAKSDKTPAAHGDIAEVARWLERIGDYESPEQTRWFGMKGNARKLAKRILRDIDNGAITDEAVWFTYARVERHLRHALWFQLTWNEGGSLRERVWSALAQAAEHLPPSSARSIWDRSGIVTTFERGGNDLERALRHRTAFDFAVGSVEVSPSASAGRQRWQRRLRGLSNRRGNGIAQIRAALALEVWPSERSHDRPEGRLLQERLRSARYGQWESLEAKVALDIAEVSVQSLARDTERASRRLPPRAWGAAERREVLVQAAHAQGLGRVAGTLRREVGAVVLGAFASPVDEAQSALVAAYRRSHEAGTDAIEASTIWAIVIGLIATFIDEYDQDPVPTEELERWIVNKCPELHVGREDLPAITDNYVRHWGQFHGPAADRASDVAILMANQAS